jgi:DNA polymerase (family 10)
VLAVHLPGRHVRPQSEDMTDGKKDMDSAAVARLLVEFGHRTELAGGNLYKARAFHRAAQSLLTLTIPLGDVIAQGRLREIPGVGPAIADAIFKFYTTGTHPSIDRMRQEIPPAVLSMLRIPGLPAQKVRQLYGDLRIGSVDELEDACRHGRLSSARGFGPAWQAKILDGIGLLRRSRGQRLIHHAAEILDAAEANLRRSHPELERVMAAGDFRRGCELVSDLRLVAQSRSGTEPQAVQLGDVTLNLSDRSRYGVTMLLATGSAAHLEQIEAVARSKRLTLD